MESLQQNTSNSGMPGLAGFDSSMTHAVEKRVMKKAMRHILPLVMVSFFISFIDRTNIGVASLQMNGDLGISASMYGFGAGLFFLMYCSMEVPSNLLMMRYGVRRWVARIMISWGLVAAGMAFVKGASSFYIMRALLGITEAGFLPAVLFYLALWFPAAYRGRVFSYLHVTGPLSFVIGAPISSALLGLDGVLGMRGWQWVFIVEALPAIVMAFVIWKFLPDGPGTAKWLEQGERQWLTDRLSIEEKQRKRAGDFSVLQAITAPRVLLLGFVHFNIFLTVYGVAFFLPQIIKGFGLTNFHAGLVSAIPSAAGCVGMLWWGRRSDAKNERRFHTAVPLAIAVVALVASTFTQNLALKMVAFSLASFGASGCVPAFWTLPTLFLSGPAMAGGIAVVNTIGALGGFFGPWIMGLVKDVTGGFGGALLGIAVLDVIAVCIVLAIPNLKESASSPRVVAPDAS